MAGGIETRRRVAVGALLAVLVAVIYLVFINNGGGHRFSTEVPAAVNLVGGSDLRSAAENIGKVTDVEPIDGGRAARIDMEIDDDDYWPLASDTTLNIRYGGTVSFSNRYIRVDPGENTDDPIPDGGELSPANVTSPVEVDTLVSYFNADVRKDFKELIGHTAGMLERGSGDLNKLLGVAPPITEGASSVFADLSANEQAFTTLIRSTSDVVTAVDRSNPDLRTLLGGAAQTFSAIAGESETLKKALDELPSGLANNEVAIAKADVTLQKLDSLVDKLGPGVHELNRIVSPLRSTLGSLRAISPDAAATLNTLGTNSPDIYGLLDQVHAVSPRIESIAKQATTEIGCVRPYAPEIYATGSGWGDYISYFDGKDNYLHAQVMQFLPHGPNSNPLTPAQALQLYPGVTYQFPAPPGYIANQPWFQPQCGVTPDVLDPTKDPEIRHPDSASDPPPLEPYNPPVFPAAAGAGGKK
jgi:phospholipid/cholesterol/gamma-HCH transport system substrate-binding protein